MTRTASRSWWALINSPLPLLLISGVVIAGGAKLYTDRQAAQAELLDRRAAYVELLAELQRRVSQLQQADMTLNPFLGDGLGISKAERIPEKGPQRKAFERASLEAGAWQADIIGGRGRYTPTMPAYANVDFLTLGARLEQLGGVPDLQIGALRLLRLFDAPPDILWLYVRASEPQLVQFVASRHMLHVNGTLPLPRGVSLTTQQELALSIPQVKPGDLEKAMRDSDALHRKLERALVEQPSD